MSEPKLKSAEIFGIALFEGKAVVECETLKEAISMRAALFNWAAYNDRLGKYEISRNKLIVTVTRKD